MKDIIQRVVVAAAIVHEDKVLIIQRAADEKTFPNLWEIPSGKREDLEKSVEGVKREAKEETGIDIEILSLLSVFEFQVEKPEAIYDISQISFLARAVGTHEVKLSEDHQNYAWISETEIDNYNLSEETKGVIVKALRSKLQ